MATLSDVARLANVSKMTVSRVINHPEKVTDELKELVYKAMREVDYHPNIAAKALVNNRTQIIKFLILEDIDVAEPYYMKLLMGIAVSLAKQQYSVQVVTMDNLDVGECDGYIITGMRRSDVEWVKNLDKPTVIFGENHDNLDYVDVDNKMGTEMASVYAMNKQYEHIIFIGIDVEESFEYAREAGYMETMQQRQLTPKIYRMGNHSSEASKFVLEHWAEFEDNTCFVCASDRLALGVVRTVQRMGVDIPNQYGVIGFDGVFLHQISDPKLTTIQQPELKMGEEIASMVINKVQENNIPQGSKLFTPILLHGGSTR